MRSRDDRLTAAGVVLLAASGTLAACGGTPEAGLPPATDVPAAFDGGGAWIDLTHAYSDETIYWPTDSLGFRLEELAFGETGAGYFYSAYRFATAEHGGTHLDAPLHFARDGAAVDEIPIDRLIGPAIVVDVSERATPDYQVGVDDLESFEVEHGAIPDGAILLIRTGWAERWPDRTAYLGTALEGRAAIPELHFPGLAPAAARWLVEHRAIGALGIDTPSIDHGQSADFETHVALYTAGVPGLENVANLARLPATGAFVIALPMKIAGGSGGPVRIAAFVPDR